MQPQSSQVSARGGPNQRQGKRERGRLFALLAVFNGSSFYSSGFYKAKKREVA